MSLLEIRDLKKYFPVGEGLFSRNKGSVKAVDGVNLTVNEGETWRCRGASCATCAVKCRLFFKIPMLR